MEAVLSHTTPWLVGKQRAEGLDIGLGLWAWTLGFGPRFCFETSPALLSLSLLALLAQRFRLRFGLWAWALGLGLRFVFAPLLPFLSPGGDHSLTGTTHSDSEMEADGEKCGAGDSLRNICSMLSTAFRNSGRSVKHSPNPREYRAFFKLCVFVCRSTAPLLRSARRCITL